MFAVCWAILKLQHFQVLTDHNPLIPILNNYRLGEIENPNIQCLHTQIMGYNFTSIWLKKSTTNTPDALSRHSISKPGHTGQSGHP